MTTNVCGMYAVPAYKIAGRLFSQAWLMKLDGTVFRTTPCPSGHGILPLLQVCLPGPVFIPARNSSFFSTFSGGCVFWRAQFHPLQVSMG